MCIVFTWVAENSVEVLLCWFWNCFIHVSQKGPKPYINCEQTRWIGIYIDSLFRHGLLHWFCWTHICPAFANSVDPDQLASSEANWSGSTLFVINYVNLYQQPVSSNLIGWKLEVGVVSEFIQHDKG